MLRSESDMFAVVAVTAVTVDVLTASDGVTGVLTGPDIKSGLVTGADTESGLVTLLLSSHELSLLRLAACNDAPAFSTSSFVTPCHHTTQCDYHSNNVQY